MENRAKTERIVIRVGELDKKTIQAMADKAKMSITDFVLSRIWGEDTHTQVSDAARSPVCVAPDAPIQDKRAALLSIPGVSLGSKVFGDGVEVATPPDAVRKKFSPRPYAWNRSGWYEEVDRGNWWAIQRDRLSGQIWVVTASRKAKEFKTVEEASGFIDENDE